MSGESTQPTPLKLVFSGGGTGGHFYPALALIQAIQAQYPNSKILFIGHPDKIEALQTKALNIPFKGIRFTGMPKNPLLLPFWMLVLILKALCIVPTLWWFRPQKIIATGGYTTAPLLLAALIAGVPYHLHEPDAHPGKVNKLFARYAATVSCGFMGAQKTLTTAVCTGNPLRSGFEHLSKAEAIAALSLPFDAQKPVLLVSGGSQGAQSINHALIRALPALIRQYQLQVIHSCGPTVLPECQLLAEGLPSSHYQLFPFINNMGAALAASDITVARAGAMSLAEIFAMGLPSILVPYPYAAANHQMHNAQSAVQAQAAIMVEDDNLTPQKLERLLGDLLADVEKRTAMSVAAKNLGQPTATEQIVGLVLKSIKS